MTDTPQDLKQPMDTYPATVHDAEKAGWKFSRHIDYIMGEYEAAITELSAAQFAYDERKADQLKNASGKNKDEREANLFPLLIEQRKRLDNAEKVLEILKVWKNGREKQLEWTRSALSFMKTDLTGNK